MRKFAVTLAAIALGALAVGNAEAMPLGAALGNAADSLGAVAQTQYVYGGRDYCWYPNGWRGPGWYWCGYHMRRGFGWGGGAGWHGWSHGPRTVVVGPRGGVAVVGPHGGMRMVRPPVRPY